MHRFRAFGLSVAVLAGAGAPSAPAADLPRPADDRPWYKRVLGADTKPPAAAPTRGMSAAPTRPTAPLAPEVVADALRAEQDAYLRRMDVCTELRRVAEETKDDGLARQVDELERQASTLYNQRTAALGVKKVKARPPAATVGTDSDDVASAGPTAPAAPAAREVTP